MAGVLAIGAAACGDDVQVVEPTPPVPPPPPPLEASMAPASAEVAVGSSVVFAVNASGGVVGEAASWTCASSNTGIATVSVTGSGCQATGVAAGGVTITATVTKGSETANVGSQLTVNAPPPFEATIAPASQSVAVGSSVVFAVNASGGYTGMMGMDDMMMGASWTCASSDDAIATVAVTDAGCQATGVAGGEVTINVAATDGHDTINLVAQLTVTTDPVAAFSAMMSPEEAEVAVGSSVVFAINVTGGAADATAEWTCASSDDAVATAETTDAGCQATGVAGGGVTINAAVTKGDDSANLASRLTVTAPDVGEPAFVLINTIKGEGDSNTGGLKGRVDVAINVERGDQSLEGLSLLVDGAVVASQSFGMAASPAQDEPAEQAVHEFTLSFDSDAYVAHGDHADIDYLNGEHTIAAELRIADSEDAISSNVVTVMFDNDDGFVVSADLGDNSALGSDGKRWYGGPANGHIMISALPVIYSGEEIGAVSVALAGCEAEEAEGDDHGDDDHHGTEASFEFDCEGEDAARAITVSVGGVPQEDNILNMDDLPTANIDMEGPANAPIIIANRNGRENGWINADVGISGKFNANNAKDNWLVEGEGGAGADGIGGYNMGVRIGASLKAALRAAATSTLPAESDDSDSYCAVAVATDNLGNLAPLPDSTGMCREAPTGADVIVTLIVDPDTTVAYGFDTTPADSTDATSVSFANRTLEFGVDTTAPIIELGNDDYDMRTIAVATDLPGIAFEPADDESNVGNSGLHSDNGLMVKAERRTASATQCITVGADGAVADDAARNRNCSYIATDAITTTVSVADRTNEQAYWTVSGRAHDQAGNNSTVVSHTFAYDNVAAQATPPAAPGVVTAGKPFQGATYLNDGLSIRDYYGTMNYGDITGATGFSLGIGAPVTVDAFNAATLTNENHPVTSQVGIVTTAGVGDPYAATQTTIPADSAGAGAGTLQPISGVSIGVRDQAGAYVVVPTAIADANVTGQVADWLGFRTDTDGFADAGYTFQYPGTATTYTVCGYAKCEAPTNGTAPPSTVKIEVRAQAAATGTFRDPFERVDFWMTDANGVAWLVGSDASGTGGRLGGDGTGGDPRIRTWSYSVTLAGTALRAATRPGTAGDAANNDADIGKIVAIGVSERGVGLVELMANAVEFGVEDND